MTKEHTPTPWSYEEQGESTHISSLYKEWVTEGGPFNPADGHHIVKCVNMHDELVENLKQAYTVCRAHDYFDSDIEETLKKAGAL